MEGKEGSIWLRDEYSLVIIVHMYWEITAVFICITSIRIEIIVYVLIQIIVTGAAYSAYISYCKYIACRLDAHLSIVGSVVDTRFALAGLVRAPLALYKYP